MSKLEIVLWVKVVVTLSLWSLPLLVLPTSFKKSWGLVSIEPPLFEKLLGWAYLALAVGYLGGIYTLRQGQWPAGVIWMGIVSNGGGAMLLLSWGILGKWGDEPKTTRIFLWSSAMIVTAITIGLVLFGLLRL